MFCMKCGTHLDDDSVFCINCGAKITEQEDVDTPPVDTPVEPVVAAVEVPDKSEVATPAQISDDEETEEINIKSKTIGLVLGTLLMIIGIIRIFGAGTSISPTSFGGDFYTYTYRGIVAISEQLGSIQASLGWIIFAIGAAIDVYALRSE